MQKKLISLLVAAIFLVSSMVTATAWEQGHMKVVPSFKTRLEYDSNIFYDRNDPKHDWLTILTPGIMGELGFGAEGKHKAFMEYFVDLGMFGKYDDQNYGNHNAFGGVSLDFEDYTLDLNNRFLFTSSRAGTEFEQRNLRKEDTFNAVLGWHYNKIDFDTGYEFYIVDYLSDTLQAFNRYENRGWIAGYVEVAPKTQALLELDYRNLQYPDTSGRNGNAYWALAGVRGQITAKVTGVAKAGYKIKDYNASSANDFSNVAAFIDIMYDMNERVDMTFSYIRDAFESTYGNNNYYTGDHFLYNLTYDLGYDFIGIFDAMYLHNAYPSPGAGEDKKRLDNEWDVKPRLEYHWKEYVVLGMDYRFHQRESNIGSRRYDQHVVAGDVKVMF